MEYTYVEVYNYATDGRNIDLECKEKKMGDRYRPWLYNRWKGQMI